jgi:hypothetical protein
MTTSSGISASISSFNFFPVQTVKYDGLVHSINETDFIASTKIELDVTQAVYGEAICRHQPTCAMIQCVFSPTDVRRVIVKTVGVSADVFPGGNYGCS